MTHIFVDILEVEKLFGDGLIDKARSAHQIDVLESFL